MCWAQRCRNCADMFLSHHVVSLSQRCMLVVTLFGHGGFARDCAAAWNNRLATDLGFGPLFVRLCCVVPFLEQHRAMVRRSAVVAIALMCALIACNAGQTHSTAAATRSCSTTAASQHSSTSEQQHTTTQHDGDETRVETRTTVPRCDGCTLAATRPSSFFQELTRMVCVCLCVSLCSGRLSRWLESERRWRPAVARWR